MVTPADVLSKNLGYGSHSMCNIIYTNSTQSYIDGGFTIFRAHKRAVLWYATPDTSRTPGHANRWITASSNAKIAFDAEI